MKSIFMFLTHVWIETNESKHPLKIFVINDDISSDLRMETITTRTTHPTLNPALLSQLGSPRLGLLENLF